MVRSLDELPAIWEEVKSKLPRMLARGLFENAVPTVDTEGRITIACPPKMFFLADDEAKKIITNTFREVLGQPVHIELIREEVVAQPEETAESSEEEVKTTPMMRRQQAEEDEQIRNVLDLFDARILETQ